MGAKFVLYIEIFLSLVFRQIYKGTKKEIGRAVWGLLKSPWGK